MVATPACRAVHGRLRAAVESTADPAAWERVLGVVLGGLRPETTN